MRISLKKALLSGLISLLILMVIAGCSSGGNSSAANASVKAPNSIVTKGTLTYGTAATFPPFEYSENNNYTGFDIDMGKAIAKKMGLKVKPVSMDFDGLIPALNGNRVDIINSAMYIKPERQKQVDFVPYMKLGNAIVTQKGKTRDIKKLSDLSMKTVAVTRGAVEAIYVQDENKALKKEGKQLIKLLTLPTANDTYLAVKNGRADAFLDSSPGVAYLMKKQSGTYEIAATFAQDTTIGMAVNKKNPQMKKAIQKALNEIVKDGTYSKLMKKYDLPKTLSYFK
ncbi:MAG: ABC transporter substrate-binding protein [Sporolactobacillus sp.]